MGRGLEMAAGEIRKPSEDIRARMPDFFDKMEVSAHVDLTKPVDSEKRISDSGQVRNTEVIREDNAVTGREVMPEKELTDKEINEKQRDAVQEAMERMRNGEKLTESEKGNLGEMLMDLYYLSQGYEPLHSRITSLEDKGHQGIDGVYEKAEGDKTRYIIADAKATEGSPQLGTTVEGTKQLSDEWIDKRLDKAVGIDKADEIREAYEDDAAAVSREVYHYETKANDDGSTRAEVCTVNENGDKNPDKEVVQIFDHNGQEIYRKTEETV